MTFISRIIDTAWRFAFGITPVGSAVLRPVAGPITQLRSSDGSVQTLHRHVAATDSLSDTVPSASVICEELGTKPEHDQVVPRCQFMIGMALLCLLLPFTAAFAATRVDNSAKANYSYNSYPVAIDSNKVSIVVRTPSVLEFLEYAPLAANAEMVNVPLTTFVTSAGEFPLPAPISLGATTPLTVGGPLPLMIARVFHENEPIFVRLSDDDQNINPTIAETVLVTLGINENGETETLRLTETGPDTGVFVGYIQTSSHAVVADNGQLSVQQDSAIHGHYTDALDSTDTSDAAVLVDPYGIVFDTTTGLPVDGATVTLIDASTGLPATIFGDDGISIYPSSVTSGGSATDSSGRLYTFRPGFYRFPYLQPGNYQILVTPPAGYRAPSVVATTEIQSLAGAPFALVDPGSRGEIFLINPGPAIHIDLPIDPLHYWLYLVKTSSKEIVAIGDFLQYRITVENTAAVDVNSVMVNDRLPIGFRYSKGSTKIGGIKMADPTLTADGRTMTFTLNSITSGATAEITYVVEVAVGAKLGKAENTAAAAGGAGVTSNLAKAEVLVKEDLFGSKSTIIGRVFPNGCNANDQSNDGVAGVRIYLEDGTYSVTDSHGMYHFVGLKAGTHVVQLDLETIPKEYELVACEENDRFAGVAYSQFVDLQGGTMWISDFYLAERPKELPQEVNGTVGIELTSVLPSGGPDARTVDYAVALLIGEVPVENQRLTVILPAGTEYIPESSRLGAVALPDPEIMENVLTYRLGKAEKGEVGQINLSATILPNDKDAELTAKALLTFDTTSAKNRRTPLVENILKQSAGKKQASNPDIILRPLFAEFDFVLSVADTEILNQIIADVKKVHVTHIYVTGHTNTTRISQRSRHILPDNYALSRARAKSVADYLAAGLELSAEQITSEGKGPDEPIASNKTVTGRSLNRRVELRILSETPAQWSELQNIKDRSGVKSIEISAVPLVAPTAAEKVKAERAKARTMPEFDGAWLETVKPGLAFIWPYEGFYPAIPSTKIAIKHNPLNTLKLLQNGEEIDPIYLDGTLKRWDGAAAVSLWIGIHLLNGDNIITAIESTTDGSELSRVAKTIHYSGSPVKAVTLAASSRLIADGKSPSVIAIRLTDKEGHPCREGLIGEYSLDPPYLPLQLQTELQNDVLTQSKSLKLKYIIGEDGIALIELQPTAQTGEAVLRFNLVNGEEEVRTWLTPGERDWIIVGLGEGTAGYDTISGNMESFSSSSSAGEENYYQDGRVAFFAKGMIQGKWLVTAAYDTAKSGVMENGSLFSTIDPNEYYTLYGDGSNQQYEAASARKLFLKIERGQFYALFGDYDTGLTVTELSRYSRSLNGLKSELKSGKIDFNLFVSDTNQAFVKDELRGDGTSGLYRLSRKNIIINSEMIIIETRDRFRSEVVISTQRLNRHIDYDIDYDAGSLYFKSPISSRDEYFNPIYIVIDYESADQGDLSFNYGGRGAVKFLENKLEIGATNIHEGRVGGEGDLTGVDLKIKLDEKTTIKAEYATTKTDFNGVSASGNAYLTELSHQSEALSGKVYWREQDGDFGLGQQMGSEGGTRKLGFDGNYRFTERLSLMSQALRQYNLATDAVRDMGEVQVRLNEKGYALHGGLRHAEDTYDNGDSLNSEQLTAGASFNLFGDSVVARIDHDQSLLKDNKNSDFPTRTTLGVDYKLNETTTLFAAQEFTHGDAQNTETTRVGLRSSPWNGGQVSSSLEQQMAENGTRIFSVNGLKQAWKITEKWSIDGGLDRSTTLKHPRTPQFNTNVPAASGDADFTAVSTGAAYQEKKWSWTGRLEYRSSDTEKKIGAFTGIAGEVREGLGMSASLQAFRTEASTGIDVTNGNLRLGLAYRPKETTWIVLDRLEYLFDEQTGSNFAYDNWRLINNLNANWKLNRKSQLSLQYGAKYVNEKIDDRDYGGFTDMIGLEGRHDLSKKWDVGLRGNLLHSWGVDQFKYGSGVSIGYNVVKNAWLGVGYNFTGFQDRDFSRADFTAQGPYVKFRFKFDQNSVRDALKQT